MNNKTEQKLASDQQSNSFSLPSTFSLDFFFFHLSGMLPFPYSPASTYP